MKVVIELIGNESKQDLLATSNYLRELAGEAVPEVTERKTDLDKLADAVVEATKVKSDGETKILTGEKTPKTVAEMVESERAKTRARRAVKPAPEEAKEEVPAPAPVEEAPAPAEPKTDAASYTIDDCKSWAMKALNAKKRPIVQEAFESVGASSFPTLKEEMFNDFVAYISSRL
nr:MAG TPA: hypothetical protein [Caudoviricetes sp.]